MCMLNILVVDDDRDSASGLANFLTLDGHTVDIAYSGEAGVSDAASTHYDLVLLDVVLPGINGFEARDEIRRADSSARVILMSGYWANCVDNTSLDMGTVDVMAKPVNLDALARRMSDLPCNLSGAL